MSEPREWEVDVPVPNRPFYSERVKVVEASAYDALKSQLAEVTRERDELKNWVSECAKAIDSQIALKAERYKAALNQINDEIYENMPSSGSIDAIISQALAEDTPQTTLLSQNERSEQIQTSKIVCAAEFKGDE